MPVPAVKVWTVRDFSSPPVSPSCRIISLHVSHLVFIINSGFYFFQKLDGRSLLKLNFAKNSEGKGPLLQPTLGPARRAQPPLPKSLQNWSLLSGQLALALYFSEMQHNPFLKIPVVFKAEMEGCNFGFWLFLPTKAVGPCGPLVGGLCGTAGPCGSGLP